MPNWVTTELHAPSHVLDAMMRDGHVDFNLIVPMPETVYRGNLGSKEEAEYPGELNWYGWSKAYWGTKWNANETERPEPMMLRFETAWSHPEPVIKALSERFSNVPIFVAYADEDIGRNLGLYVVTAGEEKRVALEDRLEDRALAEFAYRIRYRQSQVEAIAEEIRDTEHQYRISFDNPFTLLKLNDR